MSARVLMLQGTGSDVGKSLLVAALCRIAVRRGRTVRPFKPQNMSNNAAVTVDGGEIGRAQALQARAARVAPTVHMNPVLLKPQASGSAQLVVQGRMRGAQGARAYQALKPGLMAPVVESFGRLAAEAELVLVEGAGSASEVNLRAGDIANMGFARRVDAPVVLVGDIDRGGVIASLVGTQAVLDPADAAMIRGFMVNRMRGDATLFAEGMRFVGARTGWAALGLIPWFERAHELPPEDSMALATLRGSSGGRVRVVVPVLPFIANFDDLDPLRLEPEVDMILLGPGDRFPERADLVVLPGSKATLADLAALRARGLAAPIAAHAARGGAVLGLCGGYQMLGRSVTDPDGIEGPPASAPGLGLLDVETVLTGDKRLDAVEGRTLADGAAFRGYEMHVGRTDGPARVRPFLVFADGRTDGAVSADGRIAGTYVHGLFTAPGQRAAWLAPFGAASDGIDHEARIEAVLDALADHVEAHADIDRLFALASPPRLGDHP